MTTAVRLLSGAAALSLALALSPAGCKDDARDLFIASQDGGADAATEAGPDTPDATVDPTLGGPCNDDRQCDDLVPCTFDTCDKTLSRCRNTPDDTQCADNVFCNGLERCVLRQGCAPGAVVTCTDESACTIDRCIEATKTCEHVPRDSDGDGDPDDHCAPNHDCDDTDPSVSSTRQEVCGNFKDDNCNGQIDEQPCTVPANDTCAAAQTLTLAGTYLLTTVATKQDYTTSCFGSSITGAQDIVVAITVPAGAAKDVLVAANATSGSAQLILALETTCGDSSTEIQCQKLAQQPSARAIARSVAGGSTIYAIVTTTRESPVDMKVDFLAPTAHPTNETCASPLPVALDTAIPVSLVDAKVDLTSVCTQGLGGQQSGDLTYSFTLTEPRDVRIFASTTLGAGSPIVSLRQAGACANELRCTNSTLTPLFARALPIGTYVFSVAATNQIDASIVVKTSAPTTPSADQTCATAPALVPNKTFTVDLTNHEDAIQDGCFTGGSDAARALSLPLVSDVLIVGRFPFNEIGGISLDTPACDPAGRLECQPGNTPLRIARRGLEAGDYRVVIADQLGQSAEMIALVRPTVPPVTVTSDGCTDAQLIPETGGYFTGDTTNATADFNAGCDANAQPPGTAKDQLMKLVLGTPKRVVFDMTGSQLQTILDIRTGDPCPGVEVQNACNQAPGGNRSFLDITLQAGTYYVQIDGYAGSTGKWNLDVRVLDPE